MRRIAMIHGSIRTASRGALMRGLRCLALISALAVAACDSQDPTTFAEYLARAEQYRNAGEIRASLIELKNALHKDPDNAIGRLLLAQAELDLGDGVSAGIELQRAKEADAPRDRVLLLLAEIQLHLDHFEELLRDVHVGEDAPAELRAAVLAFRGRAHIGLGQIVLAEEAYKAALELDEKSVDALVGLSRLNFARGNEALGRDYLARAVSFWPRHLIVLALQGDVAFAVRDHQAAERYFRAVLDQRKDDLAALNAQLGIVRSQIAEGRIEDATALLNQILRDAPADPATNYLRALAAYQAKDYETARIHSELALRLAEGHRPSRFIAGASNYAIGRYEVALVHLTTYVNEVPGNPDARKLLAAAQMRMGQSENAVKTLRPAVDQMGGEDLQLLAMIGAASAEAGDYRSATRYLGRAVEKDPANTSLRSRLGTTQVALGNTAEGFRELEKAAAADPDGNADVALILAHLRANNFDKAFEAANRLQAKRPSDPNGYSLAGTVELARGRHDSARAYLRQALQVRPGDRNALRNLAVIAAKENDFDGARAQYREILDRVPDDEEFLILMAALETRAGRAQESRAILERAVAAHPASAGARVALGRHYLAAGEPEKTLATVQPVLKDVREATALEVVGQAQLALGQADFAVGTLRDLVSIRPESADAHQSLASAYEGADLIDRAVLETELALRYAKESPALKFQYARLLARAGKLARANQMLGELRRSYPNDPGLIELEASVAAASNRIEDAMAAYGRLFDAQPSNANLLKLAHAQVRGGRGEEAQQRIEQWLARSPDDALVRTALADFLLSRGQSDRAAQEYSKVLKVLPDNAMVLNNLAWALTKAGRATDAVAYAQRAVGFVPNSPAFLDTLGVVLLAANRPRDAVSPLRAAAERAPNDAGVQLHLAQALARDEKEREARDLLRLILRSRNQWPERAEAEALLKQIDG
jgi:putative PEP-CTERM system TPR-repeat lipoprotein